MLHESISLTGSAKSNDTYAGYVNPEWVRLLSILGLNCNIVKAVGAELFLDTGEKVLDFLSGYGVFNFGHNHPYIANELIKEISALRPTMLQSTVCGLAGQLAEKLCQLAGNKAEKVFFGSSGSEGVETAIKFSRKFTGREGILYANDSFHGLTCGALSLMSNQWWKDGFGPLLPGTKGVDFGDLKALRNEIKSEKYAAFIVEPIQGESGIKMPPDSYLHEAQLLCEKHGTLFVLDEVQTGIYRTGPFLASHLYNLKPDMSIIAKALSGGFIPVGAVLMRHDICKSVYSSADKAFVHTSTFSENTLAMRAGLATLEAAKESNIEENTLKMGEFLRTELSKALSEYDFIKEVRGAGLFNAIEFQAPKAIINRVFYSAYHKAHPGLFGQVVVKTLFEKGKILSQMAGNNYTCIKSLPPLTISKEQISTYVDSWKTVCNEIKKGRKTFWPQGLVMAGKILRTKF